MTPEELRAIRERCEAATPGEWLGTANSGVVTGDGEATVFETGCGCCTESKLTEADAAFIASARADVPALLAEVERLRSVIAHLDCMHETVGERNCEPQTPCTTCALNDSFEDEASLRKQRDEARALLREVAEVCRELSPPTDAALSVVGPVLRERDEARAELDRLRAEHVIVAQNCEDFVRQSQLLRRDLHETIDQRDEARAEVERLTRANATLNAMLDGKRPDTWREDIESMQSQRDEALGQVERLTRERDEARAIANAAVRELNDANARACIADQLSSNPKGFEP